MISDSLFYESHRYSVLILSYLDGSFTSDDRRWKKTPESISTSMVELTRQRGTQAWFIGKFSESQKSRNIVNVRSIIHPGIISRVL